MKTTLCQKCLYSKLFWSVFSRIWTEYGEIRSDLQIQRDTGISEISEIQRDPDSVHIRKNTDQNNSKYGHFSRSAKALNISTLVQEMSIITLAVKFFLVNCVKKKELQIFSLFHISNTNLNINKLQFRIKTTDKQNKSPEFLYFDLRNAFINTVVTQLMIQIKVKDPAMISQYLVSC